VHARDGGAQSDGPEHYRIAQFKRFLQIINFLFLDNNNTFFFEKDNNNT
jgi:hypothetical protein